MAVKQIELPSIGTVKLYKRKGTRSIRLSITSTGEVHVALPQWLPFKAGATFALSKASWIQAHKPQQVTQITDRQAIGKSHHIYFWASYDTNKVSSRISGTIIKIIYPPNLSPSDMKVQKVAVSACIRALRSQAEALLPNRLQNLAITHLCDYKSASIKQLKGRWGSCDSEGNIVLNLFLMQLPWNLIDYVLLHELTHTKVLHHGPQFWSEFEKLLPDAKLLRRQVHSYRPTVGSRIINVEAKA